MNNSFYNDFAARFAATTLTSLVESFNRQVGKRGFNSARAAYENQLAAFKQYMMPPALMIPHRFN